MIWWSFILIGTALGVLGALTRKKALFHEHTMEFTSFRAMVTLPLLAVLAFFIDLNISLQHLSYIVIAGGIISVGIFLRNRAVKHEEISSVSPLSGISSVFAMVLAVFFLKEIPTLQSLLGVSLVVAGIFLLEFNMHVKMKDTLRRKTIQQYMGALGLFALSAVLVRSVLLEVHAFTVTFYLWIVICAITIAWELYNFGLGDMPDFERASYAIIATAVLMFVRNLFVYTGLAFPEAQLGITTALTSTGIVMTTFVGGSFFKEKSVGRKSLASLVIAIGAIMIII